MLAFTDYIDIAYIIHCFIISLVDKALALASRADTISLRSFIGRSIDGWRVTQHEAQKWPFKMMPDNAIISMKYSFQGVYGGITYHAEIYGGYCSFASPQYLMMDYAILVYNLRIVLSF